MRFKIGAGKAAEADRFTRRLQLERVEAEAGLGDQAVAAGRRTRRLRLVFRRKAKNSITFWIGVDLEEQVAIAVQPVADDRGVRFQE